MAKVTCHVEVQVELSYFYFYNFGNISEIPPPPNFKWYLSLYSGFGGVNFNNLKLNNCLITK